MSSTSHASLSNQTWHHFEDSTYIPQKLLGILLGSFMLVVSDPPLPQTHLQACWLGQQEVWSLQLLSPPILELSPRTATISVTATLFCLYCVALFLYIVVVTVRVQKEPHKDNCSTGYTHKWS